MPERERYPELDVLKAVAILAVVLIHALPPFWVPGRHVIVLEMTRFAVPAFLAVSGFLYYQPQPVSFRVVARRLRRILLPYACVSLVAYGYGLVRPDNVTSHSLLQGLLLASMFGLYYYIFVLTEFVLLTWFLSRMPRRVGSWLFLVSAIILVWMLVAGWDTRMPFIWVLRNPLLWAPWFLLGWVAAIRGNAVCAFSTRHRRPLLVACMGVVAIWVVLVATDTMLASLQRAAGVPLITATIAGIFVLARDRQRIPPVVDAISESTYAIYLLHPFFTQEAVSMLAPLSPVTSPLSIVFAWASGLVGSAITIVIARVVLGRYSRDVIGA